MHDRASSEALATSDNLDDSDGDIEKENVIKPLDKKRSAAQAKLDEWTDMNNKSMAIKEKEIEQREREFVAKTDLDVRRLQIEEKRESRLEREGDLNLRLLRIKHEEAMLRLALQREEAQMNIRLKKCETRKRLKQQGWSDLEIDEACPLAESVEFASHES
ncbi:hypothetical protein AC1031_005766 [Aphanomyces cochlioides]|nr:hypothetical protein AC1031_005766 [Aphanomyces cochlioides]